MRALSLSLRNHIFKRAGVLLSACTAEITATGLDRRPRSHLPGWVASSVVSCYLSCPSWGTTPDQPRSSLTRPALDCCSTRFRGKWTPGFKRPRFFVGKGGDHPRDTTRDIIGPPLSFEGHVSQNKSKSVRERDAWGIVDVFKRSPRNPEGRVL